VHAAIHAAACYVYVAVVSEAYAALRAAVCHAYVQSMLRCLLQQSVYESVIAKVRAVMLPCMLHSILV